MLYVTIIKVESLLPDYIEREIDDGDGNANTRVFVVDASTTAGSVVTVTATPAPTVAEADFPSCWTLSGGTGASKLTRTIDRTTPSKTVLTVTCCGSVMQTTVYVVSCSFTASSNSDGFFSVGHAWWNLTIEPESAETEIVGKINPAYVRYVNTDAGFYPTTKAYLKSPGQVKLGPQTIGATTNIHLAVAHYTWTIADDFKFAHFLAGIGATQALRLRPGYYQLFDRNCVWAVCRIGQACPVANPAMHAFSNPGFNDPNNLTNWLNTLSPPVP
jgi:hypothetical protein